MLGKYILYLHLLDVFQNIIHTIIHLFFIFQKYNFSIKHPPPETIHAQQL